MRKQQFAVSFDGTSGGRTSVSMIATSKREVLRNAHNRFPDAKRMEAVFEKYVSV